MAALARAASLVTRAVLGTETFLNLWGRKFKDSLFPDRWGVGSLWSSTLGKVTPGELAFRSSGVRHSKRNNHRGRHNSREKTLRGHHHSRWIPLQFHELRRAQGHANSTHPPALGAALVVAPSHPGSPTQRCWRSSGHKPLCSEDSLPSIWGSVRLSLFGFTFPLVS